MCSGWLTAQSTFFYQHNTNLTSQTNQSNAPHAILETEKGYLTVGTSSIYGSSNSEGFFMFVDKDGTLIWDHFVPTEKIEEYRAVTEVEGHYYLLGFRWINNKRRNLLLKLDKDGNIILDKLFGDTLVLSLDNLAQDLVVNETGFLVATSGFDTVSSSTNAELIQIDFEGNVLWEKSFGTDNAEERLDGLRRITSNTNGYTLVMDSQNLSGDYFPHVISVDENGNELWRKCFRYYNADSTLFFSDAMAYDEDKTLVLFTREHIDWSIPQLTSNVVLATFDSEGNQIEFIEYPETYGISKARLKQNKRKEIIVIGGMELDTVGNYNSQLFAMKFDAEKNLLWQEHYGDTGSVLDIFFTGIATRDGGVALGGRIQLFQPGVGSYFNSVLYKTDCRGSLAWDYESCIDPNLVDPKIFPNPFKDQLNFHLPLENLDSQVQIKIYDLQGRIVVDDTFIGQEVIQMNTARFSSGFYAYAIWVDGSLLETGKLIKTAY